MNGAEALMWTIDADPSLRSSFLSITFLDRPPDPERLRARIGQALDANPVMRERVVGATLDLANPRWELDPTFDLDFHMRHVALPAPGTTRQLLDLAALIYADPWDRARPLWQFTVVEGLSDGGAALLAKMHHVISDGVGAVRLSASFLDLSPDGDSMSSPPREPRAEPGRSVVDTVRGTVRDTVGSALRAPQGVASLARQLAVFDGAKSPLWTERAYANRFDLLTIDLDRTKAVAKKLGGTVNDAFVTMIAAAAGAYHRALDAPADELRMAMPISVRDDHDAAGNAWVPARLLVPTGDLPVVDRFEAVHARTSAVRRQTSANFSDPLLTVMRHVPGPVLTRIVRQQTGTVDFACSNVRGAPFDLWISGAHVEHNHPMGPTAGAAFNATVLSYRNVLDLGLNYDTGAITAPELLKQSIEESVDAVLGVV